MKIKKIISGIMAVLVLFGAVTVFSVNPVCDYSITASAIQYGTYENLTYRKYSDYIEISDCKKSAEEIIIPAEIKGLPVTSIGDGAFATCSGLTSITLPDNVTNIGRSAFSYCGSLTSITLPDNVINIGRSAFEGCSGLTEITIPENVISIGVFAFDSCFGLISITIPESVTSIGDSAFNFTPWLEEKRKENPLVIVNNILIDGKTYDGDVVIPDDVTSIGDSAFFNCSGLTSVTLPDSVTSIGYDAFFECSSLTSIIIPDGVTSIGNSAFRGCSCLKEITILNPDCEIYDSIDTVCNGFDDDRNGYFNGTICGYENSTAQAYAEKYGYNFEAIKENEKPETLLGDANCDGEISVADATLILQYCGNKDKYNLTEQGKINADIDGTAGISAVDALMIQQYDAGIINKF
ncbi:MAG: leucine-rich repeat protein [Ruminococcus sp.]|nr:leucine-rich repeat protein [Ruminococcus sp.]